MRHAYLTSCQVAAFACLSCLVPASHCFGADEWMTWASTYTHEPVTGQRVDQYALPARPMGPSRTAVQRSGYRHYRSTLQAGQSVDNMHIVEKWGEPVAPYEHWRFPFRPYGVPYDAWGPAAPYGILNGQLPGFPGWGLPGAGYGGPAHQLPGYHGPGGAPIAGRGGAGTGVPPQGLPAYGGYPGYGASRGFPLQPGYYNQPWFDGSYPSAAPLDLRTDRQFFYHPPLGRAEQPTQQP